MRERESERERQTDRERDRDRDRQTDRQTDRDREMEWLLFSTEILSFRNNSLRISPTVNLDP